MTDDAPTVVSTTPSGTEILFALGIEPAAVSDACDYPAAAIDLPRVNTSRVDARESAERDDQAGGDVYDVDLAVLRRIEPDLIVTQSVCGVCAVDEELIETHLDDLSTEPSVMALSASDLHGVSLSVRKVGESVGRQKRAREVVDRFEARLDGLAERTGAAEYRPSVAVIEWMDPLHVAGNWVPELVRAAGGEYPLADPGQRSRELAWERVREADPDVLVVAPCSYDRRLAVERSCELRDWPGWETLRAVRKGRVHAFDGRAMNRWTPRLADVAERLASVVQPRLFEDDPAGTAIA